MRRMLAVSKQRQTLLIGAGLFVLTLIVFWPAVHCDFICYDDPDYVLTNGVVLGGVSWGGIKWAITTFHASNWHPLTWLSHMLDVANFGTDPFGHHLTSIGLHATNAALLFLLLQAYTGATWRSAIVAGIFALHPLRVESVVWISERKDVLSVLFLMLTLLAYLRYVRNPQWQTYALVCLLYACGLMSKPMLVTVPILLLLLDFWPLGRLLAMQRGEGTDEPRPSGGQYQRSIWQLIVEKMPLLVMAACSSLLTLLAQRGTAVATMEALTLDVRLANAALSYLRYLAKLVWPSGLAIPYPYPDNLSAGPTLAAGLILLAITIVALKDVRRRPYLLTGWVWYLASLLPVIGLIQVGTQSIADRYTYIPSIGILVVLVWGLGEFLGEKKSWAPWIIAGVATLFLGLSTMTRQYIGCWKSSITLFERATSVTSRNYVALYNLGYAYLAGQNPTAATDALERSLAIEPKNAMAQATLAKSLLMQSKVGEALEHYRAAFALAPNRAEIEHGYGVCLAAAKQYAEAANRFREILRKSPGMADVHRDLAMALEAQDNATEALAEMRLYLDHRPNDVAGLTLLGYLSTITGDLVGGKVAYARALASSPQLRQTLRETGRQAFRQGDAHRAKQCYEALTHIDPDDPQAYEELGLLYMAQSNAAPAAKYFMELTRCRPDASSFYQLALANDFGGNFRSAISNYQTAIKLAPDWPQPLNDLAWLLATQDHPEFRDGLEAVKLAEQACRLTEYKSASHLGTLDAAYAEVGKFAEAIRFAQKASEMAEGAGQLEIATAAKSRIRLYQEEKPFRQNRNM